MLYVTYLTVLLSSSCAPLTKEINEIDENYIKALTCSTILIMQLDCRYTPTNIENMFSKYGRTVPDKFTLGELWNMTEGNREAFDFFGWFVPSEPFSFPFQITSLLVNFL